MRPLIALGCVAMIGLAGCATHHAESAAAPDYAPLPGAALTPSGELYAACISEAIQARRQDILADSSTRLLRFTCAGEPARRLYAALGDWSAGQHSEWIREGRTWRSTARIKKDLFGADYCWSDSASMAQCVITLNVGAFLTSGGPKS